MIYPHSWSVSADSTHYRDEHVCSLNQPLPASTARAAHACNLKQVMCL